MKDAPILILDEATSALDSESEAAIQDKLNLVMEGKTVIAIAHRLSTIASMDRIIVLDHGRIVEEGRPEELVEQGGLFARLWKRQSGALFRKTSDRATGGRRVARRYLVAALSRLTGGVRCRRQSQDRSPDRLASRRRLDTDGEGRAFADIATHIRGNDEVAIRAGLEHAERARLAAIHHQPEFQ